ncbi:MAG: RNA polymerase sigma factor [Stappiaceae bacterium]
MTAPISATLTVLFSTHLRACRPRAMAALSRYFRDLDMAEDAYQEACVRALAKWPDQGLPDSPLSWLITVGRNYGLDIKRKNARLVQAYDPVPLYETQLPDEKSEAIEEILDNAVFRDDFVRLLFTCCHPILSAEHQIALALKIVVGLSVDEIARAFLIKSKTMEQRITRAKKKITAAKIPFDPPSPEDRSTRLRAVLLAIYLLFNEGYAASGGDHHLRIPLCEEAIRLARLLVRLFPEEPEVRGLLALCLLHHARHETRLGESGEIILLKDQDRSSWNRPLIQEGRVLLEAALRHKKAGPLQIQAAIAATHTSALSSSETDWPELERLYRALVALQPSPVVRLNWAVAVYHVQGITAALDILEPLSEPLAQYAYFHGTLGVLLAEQGNVQGARKAYEKALALTLSEAEKSHIRQRLIAL